MVFLLENVSYLVGIVALVLVSVLNLIPPMAMGRVIDAITSGQLTQQALLLFYLLPQPLGCAHLLSCLAYVYPHPPNVWD